MKTPRTTGRAGGPSVADQPDAHTAPPTPTRPVSVNRTLTRRSGPISTSVLYQSRDRHRGQKCGDSIRGRHRCPHRLHSHRLRLMIPRSSIDPPCMSTLYRASLHMSTERPKKRPPHRRRRGGGAGTAQRVRRSNETTHTVLNGCSILPCPLSACQHAATPRTDTDAPR